MDCFHNEDIDEALNKQFNQEFIQRSAPLITFWRRKKTSGIAWVSNSSLLFHKTALQTKDIVRSNILPSIRRVPMGLRTFLTITRRHFIATEGLLLVYSSIIALYVLWPTCLS